MPILRPQVVPPKRQGFTKTQRAKAFIDAKGCCALCEQKIKGPWEIDHIIERSISETAHRPSNWRVLCKPCHTAKTAARAPVLAKVERLRKQTFGETKPKRSKWAQRKLQGRGFDKALRKRMNGTVERRP